MGSQAGSSAESVTVRSMSITGFAGRPGTAVEPMCSTASAFVPSAPRIRSASDENWSGQVGSGSTTSMPARGDFPGTQADAPSGGSTSWWRVISSGAGIRRG